MILPAVVKLVRFDLARYFRSISTYIYFLLMAAIAFLLTVTAGGAFQGASVSMGGGGKVLVNSPFTLMAFISIVSYYGLLIVSAIAGKAAYQDFEYQTHPSYSPRRSVKGRIWAGGTSRRRPFSWRFFRVWLLGWRWQQRCPSSTIRCSAPIVYRRTSGPTWCW
jgi:hypothetical protein